MPSPTNPSRLSSEQIEGVFRNVGKPNISNSIFRFADWHGQLTPRLHSIRVGPPFRTGKALVLPARREIYEFLYSKGATREFCASISMYEAALSFGSFTEPSQANDPRLDESDGNYARGAARRYIISEMLLAGFSRKSVGPVLGQDQEKVHLAIRQLGRETEEALAHGATLPSGWPIRLPPGPLKAIGFLREDIQTRLLAVLKPEDETLLATPAGLTDVQILSYKMRIACFLTAHGLPQKEAAEMLQVPLTTIAEWSRNISTELSASLGRSTTLDPRQGTEGDSWYARSSSIRSALRRVVLMALLEAQPSATLQNLEELLGLRSAIDLQRLIRLLLRETSPPSD